jgi:hypothetical protein
VSLPFHKFIDTRVHKNPSFVSKVTRRITTNIHVYDTISLTFLRKESKPKYVPQNILLI